MKLLQKTSLKIKFLSVILLSCISFIKIEATGWTGPQNLSTTTFRPLVMVDPSGNAVAIWRNRNGTIYNIQGSSMPVGSGAWTTAIDISDPTLAALSPRLEMDSTGNAFVVWTGWNGSNFLIYAAMFPAGGSWPTYPATAISSLGQDSFGPHLSVGTTGYAIVSWITFSGGVYSTQTAIYSP